MELAELQKTRRDVAEISLEDFVNLSQEERLSNSFSFTSEKVGGAAVTLRALDPENVTIERGKRTGWRKVCAMQLVGMRTNGYPVIDSDVQFTDQPDYVAPWVGDLVIRLNDGMPDTLEGDNWRKKLLLPFIDPIAMAGKKSTEAAQSAAFYMADWVSRSLLPELLEHPDVNLLERAEAQRQLEPVVDTGTANASQDAARAISSSEKSGGGAAWASCWYAAEASTHPAWASRHAAEASRYAANASTHAAEVLGWPRVSELARRLLLPGVIARSVNTEDHARLAIARTNKDVARALDEMASAV